MARMPFAGTADDYTFKRNGQNNVEVIGATLTIWDSHTGGTQLTDLSLDAAGTQPITQVVVPSSGQIPQFYGPDGVAKVWVDPIDTETGLPSGVRTLMITDLIDSTDAAVAPLIPASSGSAVSDALNNAFATGLNVRSKGAKLDGTTDDSAAFVAAFASAAAFGGEVYAEGGTAVVNTVAVTTAATLRLLAGATLKHKSTSTNHMFVVTGTRFELLGPGTIDGNHAGQDPAARRYIVDAPIPNGTSIKVRDIRFTGTQAAAVHATNFGGELAVTNCRFENMDQHDGTLGHWTAAVYVESGQTGQRGHCRFNNNTLIGTNTPTLAGGSPGGVFFAPTLDYPNGVGNFSTIEAVGNYFWGIGQNCGGNDIGPLHTYPAVGGARFVGNYFEQSGFCAIAAKSVQDFVCIGNVIVNGQTSAQNVAAEGAISHAAGYHADTTRYRAVITGNIIDNPGGESATVIQDGIVSEATTTEHAADVVIANNVLSGCGNGIRANYVDGLKIANNSIKGGTGMAAGTQHGIRIDNCGGMVTISGNDVTVPNGSCLYGLAGLSGANVAVTNNYFTHTAAGFTAVVLRGAAVEKFTGNLINSVSVAISVTTDGTNDVGTFYWDLSNNIVAGTVSFDYAHITKAAGHQAYPNAPEGLVKAGPGVLYSRTSSGGTTMLYVKVAGTAATGWMAVGGMDSGATASRPTQYLYAGRMFFDTTLGKPIYYNGTGWVDATGTAA